MDRGDSGGYGAEKMTLIGAQRSCASPRPPGGRGTELEMPPGDGRRLLALDVDEVNVKCALALSGTCPGREPGGEHERPVGRLAE